MNIADIRAGASAVGAQVKDCGGGHVQIIGNYLVNFYPKAKRGPTYYIAGMARGLKFKGNVAKLIGFAFNPPSQAGGLARKKRYGNYKNHLFDADPRCVWCGKTLNNWEEARLDHKIPISKGGSHGYDNLVLACVPCDGKKGNKMPHEVHDVTGQDAAQPMGDVSPETPPVPMRTEVGQPEPSLPDEPPREVPSAETLAAAAAEIVVPGQDEKVKRIDKLPVEFVVVGYWIDSDTPFIEGVTAFSWEDAVCMVRDRFGDTGHDRTAIVEVLCDDRDGHGMVGQTGSSKVLRGPIGRSGLALDLLGDVENADYGDAGVGVDHVSVLAGFIANTCDLKIPLDQVREQLALYIKSRFIEPKLPEA